MPYKNIYESHNTRLQYLFQYQRILELQNPYITNDLRKDRKEYTTSGEEGREWSNEECGKEKRVMNGERITNIDTKRAVSLDLYKEAFIK